MHLFKNIDKLLNIFSNYQGQNDKVLSCLELESMDEVSGVLLTIVNELIKEDMALDNEMAVNNIIKYINDDLKSNKSLDRTEISRKIRKILESINFFLLEENFVKYTKKEYRTYYYYLTRKIMKFPIVVNDKDKYLDIIWIIIKEIKNIDYLAKSLEIFDIDNSKNSFGNTFIMELLNIYVENVKKDDINEMKYYGSVIKLVLEKSDFKLSDEEQEWCISKLKEAKTYFFSSLEVNSLKQLLLNDLIESFECSFDNAKIIRDLAMRYNISLKDSNIILPDFIINKHLSDRVLSSDYIISIDNERTREVDDALSCEKLSNGNYLLGVHIADVFGYINIDNEVIDMARDRCETIYLKNLFVPMFPIQFTTKYGSLMENRERYAESHYFEITKGGQIISDIIMPSIICNSKKTTYEYINNYIEKEKSVNKNFDDTIHNLIELQNILETKTFSDCFSLNYFNESLVKDSVAEKIIMYTMLLENERQAKFFYENSLPLIYRVDNLKQIDKVKEELKLQNELIDNNIQMFLKKIDKDRRRVIYGMDGTISDLKFEHYTHSTSPLRRFADLWNRYLIREFRCNKKCDVDDLEKRTIYMIDIINKRMEEISHFSSEYNNYTQKIKIKK